MVWPLGQQKQRPHEGQGRNPGELVLSRKGLSSSLALSTPQPWALGWHLLQKAPSTPEARGTGISDFSFLGNVGSVAGREQRPDPHPKRLEAHPVDPRCWAGVAPRSSSHGGGDGRDTPWAEQGSWMLAAMGEWA